MQNETPFLKEFTIWLLEVADVSNHLQKPGKFLQSHLALPCPLQRVTQAYFGHHTTSSLNDALYPK